jgi:L-seryl-tRNA(Ser) seleniumtransferase
MADHGELEERARRLAAELAELGIDARPAATEAAVGGGGAPGQVLPSSAVSLPAEFAYELRAGVAVRRGTRPAVVGRIENGRLLLDLRAVAPAEDAQLAAAITAAAS